MSIKFEYQTCKQSFEAEYPKVGQMLPCPNCNKPVDVPVPPRQNIADVNCVKTYTAAPVPLSSSKGGKANNILVCLLFLLIISFSTYAADQEQRDMLVDKNQEQNKSKDEIVQMYDFVVGEIIMCDMIGSGYYLYNPCIDALVYYSSSSFDKYLMRIDCKPFETVPSLFFSKSNTLVSFYYSEDMVDCIKYYNVPEMKCIKTIDLRRYLKKETGRASKGSWVGTFNENKNVLALALYFWDLQSLFIVFNESGGCTIESNYQKVEGYFRGKGHGREEYPSLYDYDDLTSNITRRVLFADKNRGESLLPNPSPSWDFSTNQFIIDKNKSFIMSNPGAHPFFIWDYPKTISILNKENNLRILRKNILSINDSINDNFKTCQNIKEKIETERKGEFETTKEYSKRIEKAKLDLQNAELDCSKLKKSNIVEIKKFYDEIIKLSSEEIEFTAPYITDTNLKLQQYDADNSRFKVSRISLLQEYGDYRTTNIEKISKSWILYGQFDYSWEKDKELYVSLDSIYTEYWKAAVEKYENPKDLFLYMPVKDAREFDDNTHPNSWEGNIISSKQSNYSIKGRKRILPCGRWVITSFKLVNNLSGKEYEVK